MHRRKHSSWWERGAINLGVALGIGGLVVVGAGAGVGMQRTVFASEDGSGTGGFVNRRAAVPVFDCPGGSAVDTLHNGDRIFASGVHDELEGWLEIRHPNDPGRGFWIERRFITPDESTGDLEPVPCTETEVFYGEPPATTTSSSTTTTTTTRPGQDPSDQSDDSDDPSQPGQTPTTQPSSGGGGGGSGSSDTTTTTTPSGGGGSPGTTTTTAAPDNSNPDIGTITSSETDIVESNPPTCSNDTAQISVPVTDTGTGVASVSITATANGVVRGGAATLSGGQWRRTVGPWPLDTVPNGSPGFEINVSITVTATDGAGNQSSKTNTTALDLQECFG